MNTPDLLDLSRDLSRQRRAHAWITVTAVQPPSSAYVGAQAIVEADGEMHGWVGGGCVQGAARAAALHAIASASAQKLRLSNNGDASDGVDVRPLHCVSNGEVELFIQPKAVTPRLRIYGSTPVARAAAWLARETDFDPLTDAEVADIEALDASLEAKSPRRPGTEYQRETYALVATQGDGDEAALEAALRSTAKAVLVVASSRKAKRLREAMALRGIDNERVAAMHAPAGPDIGAVTPNEIALAAVAGLISLRHSYTAGGASQRARARASLEATSKNDSPRPPIPTGYVNPVCGAVIDPTRALSSLTLEGQAHHFCCEGCRTEFERNPEKYLAIGRRMREPAMNEPP